MTNEEKQRLVSRIRATKFKHALIPELTALENVVLPLLAQRLSEKEAYERATDALSKVNLKEHLCSCPVSFRRRSAVSIARAVAHNPKMILARL